MRIHRPGRAARGPLMRALLIVPISALTLAGCGNAAPAAGDAIVIEPELIADDSPFRYPLALWDEGVEGETVLMVRVTDAGAVDSAYVLETSGQAAFDSAAVNGARDLRFAPGQHDDRHVTMWARLPVRFSMHDIPPADAPPAPGAPTGAAREATP